MPSLSGGAEIEALAVFVIFATLGVAGPLMATLAAGSGAEPRLATAQDVLG